MGICSAWVAPAAVLVIAGSVLSAPTSDAVTPVPGTGAVPLQAESTEQNVTPLCFMLPLFTSPPPIEPDDNTISNPYAVVAAHGMMLAAKHINNLDCSVLGPGCSELLRTGGEGSGRISIQPLVENYNSDDPRGAPRAVQACAGTEAELFLGLFSSQESTQVATFVGGLGRFLWSSNAGSPALARRDLYPNFARTSANQAEHVISLVRFIRHLGWTRVTVMHSQDVYGAQLTEVFTEEARKCDLRLDSISLGVTQSNDEAERAALQLMETETKVVAFCAYSSDLPRILNITKRVMDDAGVDFYSYTWMGLGSTESVVDAAERSGEEELVKLVESMALLGAAVDIPTRDDIGESFSALTGGELLADVKAGMNLTGSWMDGFESATASFLEAHDSLDAETSIHAHFAYDMVWSAAISIAVATAGKVDTEAEGTRVTGDDIMRVLETDSFPPFNGSTGWHDYLTNGDWNLNHTFVEITNYGTPPGASKPRHAVVANVSLEDYSVTLVAEETIVWNNGEQYPYVPPDSMSPDNSNAVVWKVLVACGVGVGLLSLLSAFLLVRNKYLDRRVQELVDMARDEMDLESPMVKMLDFLRRYQQRWHRPSASEAARLEGLIVSQSGALTVPDLVGGVPSSELDAGIRNFLLANMFRGGSYQRGKSARISSPSDSVVDINALEQCELSAAEQPSEQVSQWLEGVSTAVKEQIATDFFVDLVTPESFFREHPRPMCLVVEQSLQRLGILQSPTARDRMLRFASLVEEGYPGNDNYHCKLHGADVTSRLLAIVHQTGLVDMTACPGKRHSQSVGLVSMVAGMVHDYGHPQINNACLIEEESEMAYDFNNQAVAEQFSLRETMKMLRDENLNFLAPLADGNNGGRTNRSTAAIRKSFHSTVIHMVLGTDMSKHFDLLSQFETKVMHNKKLRAKKNPQELWADMDDNQRMLVLQMAIKVADIGHCAVPMHIHREWVKRLEGEFFAQGDRERAKGINTVSPLMDRRLPGASAPQNQIGFFKVIVLPLVKAWVEVFPCCSPILDQVEANLHFYKTQVNSTQHSATSDDNPSPGLVEESDKSRNV